MPIADINLEIKICNWTSQPPYGKLSLKQTINNKLSGVAMEIDKLSQKSGIRSEVLREIIQLAKQNNVKRVILFGSRARGDYKERSDIDIAFRGGNSSSFILSVDEETSTLLEFDVIDLDKPVREDLLQSIVEEGILIYEE